MNGFYNSTIYTFILSILRHIHHKHYYVIVFLEVVCSWLSKPVLFFYFNKIVLHAKLTVCGGTCLSWSQCELSCSVYFNSVMWCISEWNWKNVEQHLIVYTGNGLDGEKWPLHAWIESLLFACWLTISNSLHGLIYVTKKGSEKS